MDYKEIMGPLREKGYVLGASRFSIKAAKTKEDVLRLIDELKHREVSYNWT